VLDGEWMILEGAVQIRLARVAGVAGFGEQAEVREREPGYQGGSVLDLRNRGTPADGGVHEAQDQQQETEGQGEKEQIDLAHGYRVRQLTGARLEGGAGKDPRCPQRTFRRIDDPQAPRPNGAKQSASSGHLAPVREHLIGQIIGAFTAVSLRSRRLSSRGALAAAMIASTADQPFVPLNCLRAGNLRLPRAALWPARRFRIPHDAAGGLARFSAAADPATSSAASCPWD
jgi:hypothetical protein